MSYSDAEVFAATSAMDKYRGGEEGEAGSALVVVGLSAERAAKETDPRRHDPRCASCRCFDPAAFRRFRSRS